MRYRRRRPLRYRRRARRATRRPRLGSLPLGNRDGLHGPAFQQNAVEGMGRLHGERHGSGFPHGRLGLAEGARLGHRPQASQQRQGVRAIGRNGGAHALVGEGRRICGLIRGGLGSRLGSISKDGLGGQLSGSLGRTVNSDIGRAPRPISAHRLIHGSLLASLCDESTLPRKGPGPKRPPLMKSQQSMGEKSSGRAITHRW